MYLIRAGRMEFPMNLFSARPISDSPPSGFSSMVAALRSGRKACSRMLKNRSLSSIP